MTLFEKFLALWIAAFVFGFLLFSSGFALAQSPAGTNSIGPGSSFGATIFATMYPTPSGLTPQTIASLPTCTAPLVGGHAFLSNGAVSTPGGAVSSTGAVYGVEVVCSVVSAGPTYGWVYN